MTRRSVPVSHLAAYADDPAGYCERRGAPYSPSAAIEGERQHQTLVKRTRLTGLQVVLALAALTLILYCIRIAWFS